MPSVLISSRWELRESIFLECRRNDGVILDIGPFPQDPNDAQTNEAYEHLANSHLDFLMLGETEWVLDAGRLAEEFPELKAQGLTGRFSHLPVFETSSILLPTPDRFYNRYNRYEPTFSGCYFLRIHFGSNESAPDGIPPDFAEGDQNAEASAAPDDTSASLTTAPESSDENSIYLYSKLSLETCLQKLKPFVPLSHDSGIVQMPVHSFDYEVMIDGNSFTIRYNSKGAQYPHYRSCFSGVFKREKDEGTFIAGDFGVERINIARSFMPTLGIFVSIGMILRGFRGMQVQDVPLSETMIEICFLIGGVITFFIAGSVFKKDGQERKLVRVQEKAPLMKFIQETLETEMVERDGVD